MHRPLLQQQQLHKQLQQKHKQLQQKHKLLQQKQRSKLQGQLRLQPLKPHKQQLLKPLSKQHQVYNRLPQQHKLPKHLRPK